MSSQSEHGPVSTALMTDQRGANSIDRHIGNKVRERRLEIGMSQERLADALGITFQQVQKYEKGVNRIAASRLFEMTHALDVNIAYFFAGLTVRPSKPKRGSKPG